MIDDAPEDRRLRELRRLSFLTGDCCLCWMAPTATVKSIVPSPRDWRDEDERLRFASRACATVRLVGSSKTGFLIEGDATSSVAKLSKRLLRALRGG